MDTWLRNLIVASGVVLIALAIYLLFFTKPAPPPPPPTADLSLTLTADATAPVGPADAITYQLGYRNGGPGRAQGVVLAETVPNGTSLDDVRSDPRWTCQGPSQGSLCSLRVDTVSSGMSGSATFAVVVDSLPPSYVTEIVNVAMIRAGDTGPSDDHPDNNQAEVRTPVKTSDQPPPDNPGQPDQPSGDVVVEPSSAFCRICREHAQQVGAPLSTDYENQCQLCWVIQRIDPAQGGYTVVVGSWQHRSTAEEDMLQYENALDGSPSPPMGVIPSHVGDEIRYRVGIGQEATRQEAAALKERLSSLLPEGAWVAAIEDLE